MARAATAAAYKTQKAGAPTPAPAVFFNSNVDNNSLPDLRVQRVMRLTGVSAAMAHVVAPLIFGGAS